MDTERALLAAIPADPTAAFVLADYLEEQGRIDQADLLRLSYTLREPVGITPEERQTGGGVETVWLISDERRRMEQRLQSILAQGVRPVVPTYTNSVGMTFGWIPPGTFLMGSPPDEEGRRESEAQHLATLTQGYWMGVTPVTQAQWQAVMGGNPSVFKGKDLPRAPCLPVESVSWDDCQGLVGKLTQNEGKRYSLPTEAQWECACRAGTTTAYCSGDGLEALKQVGWWFSDGNCTKEPKPVGSFRPNAWGLFDMHGNVCEWCADWRGEYPSGHLKDYSGPPSGQSRVLRGGSWNDWDCRSACRSGAEPYFLTHFFGVRLALQS